MENPSNKMLELVEELAKSPEGQGAIQRMMDLSTEALELLERAMRAKSPEEAKKLEKAMLECQKELLEQHQKLCTLMGTTPEEVEKMVDDPSNFSSEQWGFLEAIKHELKDKAQTAFAGAGAKRPATHEFGKKSSQWISA